MSTSGKAPHAEVPMIRQVAPESSSPSLQPSTSEASIIRFLSTMAACVGMICVPLSVVNHAKPVQARKILLMPSYSSADLVSSTQECAHVA